jgi:putative ABC transport system ATP-binding protein
VPEDPTPNSGSLVHTRDLWKSYPMGDVTVDALRGVSLDLAAGRFIVLLGHSGSGKTTLLNLIGGLDTATKGEMEVCGYDLTAQGDEGLTEFRREYVGFIFQLFNLVPTLTAEENVKLVGQLVGRGEAAAECLNLVGLGDYLDHLPAQLSGGQQQRVAIARAIVKEPQLLLADEPTGSLDADTGRKVLSLLWERTRETDMTMIMVTHNRAFSAVGDVVVELRSGEVVSVTEHEAEHPESIEF